MLGHIFLSQSACGCLLKLRILGELRPTDAPETIDGRPCFLDGLEFTNLEFDQASLGEAPRPVPAQHLLKSQVASLRAPARPFGFTLLALSPGPTHVHSHGGVPPLTAERTEPERQP